MNKEKLIAKIDEEKKVINKDDTWEEKLMKAEFNRALLIAKEIILSEPEETCENCDYREREAKKWCSQLSELRYKIKQQICDKCQDEDTGKCEECNK